MRISEPGRTPLHLVLRRPVDVGRDCDGLLLANPGAFPTISSQPKIAAVRSQVKTMRAEHSMYADYTQRNVAFFESFNGLYKWELICRQGPWVGIEDVEFATMSYVDWFNHRRLHGEITGGPSYTTPAEFEADHYRQISPTRESVTQ